MIESDIISTSFGSVNNAVAIWCSASNRQISAAIMPRLSKCKYVNGAVLNKASDSHGFIVNRLYVKQCKSQTGIVVSNIASIIWLQSRCRTTGSTRSTKCTRPPRPSNL